VLPGKEFQIEMPEQMN